MWKNSDRADSLGAEGVLARDILGIVIAEDTSSSCNRLMNPMRFILLCLAGWVNREQQAVIEFLLEEIRVLKEIHGEKPCFNDAERRRLAAKAKKIRYGKLKEIANIATPQTLLRWIRALVPKKYDSSGSRRGVI